MPARLTLRPFGPRQLNDFRELGRRDPVRFNIPGSILARQGLPPEGWWGMWLRSRGSGERLVAVLTHDEDGRTGVWGPAGDDQEASAALPRSAAPVMVALGDAPLTFIDARSDLAEGLAALRPPTASERLSIETVAAAHFRPRHGASSSGGRTAQRATPDDAPALTEFYNSSPLFGGRTVESMRESLRRLMLWYVPATDEESRSGLAPTGIASSAWASANLPGAARLAGIYTPPALTGRGLASLATSAVCAEVLGRGLVPCLWVSHDNPAAMKVYDRLGFQPVEEVTKLRYVDGEVY